jgi:golgi-specific brefeldin A-resistance guanine nucleotide exchange factor 1
MAGSTITSMSRRAVSEKHILRAEILAVTSTMRKNSRWASTHFVNARDSAFASNLGLRRSNPGNNFQGHVRGSRESDLMAGFQDLKRIIRDMDGEHCAAFCSLCMHLFE